MTTTKAATIDEYIARYPKETQKVLKQLRLSIQKTAPGVEEVISYAMPAFKLRQSYLVYFAAYTNHIGLYPAPTGIASFKKEFSAYKTGKGSIQFPLDRPLPFDLITKIVRYRMNELPEKPKKKPGK